MMRLVLVATLLTGCASNPFSRDEGPLEGVSWRESDDGRIALCTDDDVCYRPSVSTWSYFLDQQCPVDATADTEL